MFIACKIDGFEHFVNVDTILNIYRISNSIFATMHTGDCSEDFTEVMIKEIASYSDDELAEKAMAGFRSALIAGTNFFSFLVVEDDVFDEYNLPF